MDLWENLSIYWRGSRYVCDIFSLRSSFKKVERVILPHRIRMINKNNLILVTPKYLVDFFCVVPNLTDLTFSVLQTFN